MGKKQTSIIISVDNNFELIENFFSHLFNLQLNEDIFEYIVVIDSCRDIKTINYLKNLNSTLKNFNLTILEDRVGYAIANNLGVTKAKYEYLLFINTDVFPEKNAIQELLKYLIQNLNIGCVQGLLLYPQTNKVQSTGHIFTYYLNRHALKNLDKNEPIIQIIQERQALTSAFYMIPKKIYNKMKGMDEFFFNAYDGMELSLRISINGYKCMYYPKAVAYHATGASRNFMKINEEQQIAYFWVKWFHQIKVDLEDLLLLQINQNMLNKKYFVIDFGTVNLLWEETLRKVGISFDKIYKVDTKFKLNGNFLVSLPFSFQQTNMPLLFICDEYTDIIANNEWFKNRRNKNDVIFDLNGNVILPHSRVN